MPETPAIPGMTLRDWLAGQALTGLLTMYQSDDQIAPRRCAAIAYELADAMLIVRARKHPAWPE
jgi:hypothetical protein